MKAKIEMISNSPRKGSARLVSETGEALHTVEAWVHTRQGREYADDALREYARLAKIKLPDETQ